MLICYSSAVGETTGELMLDTKSLQKSLSVDKLNRNPRQPKRQKPDFRKNRGESIKSEIESKYLVDEIV